MAFFILGEVDMEGLFCDFLRLIFMIWVAERLLTEAEGFMGFMGSMGAILAWLETSK